MRDEAGGSAVFCCIPGGSLRRIMNGRGHSKAGQAGGGGATRAQDAAGLALCYLISPQLSPRWLQNINRKDHRGGRSSGRRGGVLIIRLPPAINEIDNRNRPAPLVASAEATGERGQNL